MAFLVSDFNAQVARTDRRQKRDAIRIAVLGIFGELGSLTSEVKKRIREGSGYVSYRALLVEEAGDLLWYFAALGQSLNSPFHTLLTDAVGFNVPETMPFSALQRQLRASETATEQDPWLLAARDAGRLAEVASRNEVGPELRPAVVSALRSAIRAMISQGVSIASAARHNSEKSTSRFPTEMTPLPLYDERKLKAGEQLRSDEKLPKIMSFDFEEANIGSKKYVIQKVFTIKVGDPLTDNIGEEDDYRFHDVFHLAFAANLGWSPVLRALLKAKRKSVPRLDENEDGARAILIEEGISTWIFNQAKPHYFEGVKRVDYMILKTIKEFVRGYEVEDQPFWAWERAILQGYEAFRQLKVARRGRVDMNLEAREIRFITSER
jgi:hypothetical protein